MGDVYPTPERGIIQIVDDVSKIQGTVIENADGGIYLCDSVGLSASSATAYVDVDYMSFETTNYLHEQQGVALGLRQLADLGFLQNTTSDQLARLLLKAGGASSKTSVPAVIVRRGKSLGVTLPLRNGAFPLGTGEHISTIEAQGEETLTTISRSPSSQAFTQAMKAGKLDFRNRELPFHGGKGFSEEHPLLLVYQSQVDVVMPMQLVDKALIGVALLYKLYVQYGAAWQQLVSIQRDELARKAASADIGDVAILEKWTNLESVVDAAAIFRVMLPSLYSTIRQASTALATNTIAHAAVDERIDLFDTLVHYVAGLPPKAPLDPSNPYTSWYDLATQAQGVGNLDLILQTDKYNGRNGVVKRKTVIAVHETAAMLMLRLRDGLKQVIERAKTGDKIYTNADLYDIYNALTTAGHVLAWLEDWPNISQPAAATPISEVAQFSSSGGDITFTVELPLRKVSYERRTLPSLVTSGTAAGAKWWRHVQHCYPAAVVDGDFREDDLVTTMPENKLNLDFVTVKYFSGAKNENLREFVRSVTLRANGQTKKQVALLSVHDFGIPTELEGAEYMILLTKASLAGGDVKVGPLVPLPSVTQVTQQRKGLLLLDASSIEATRIRMTVNGTVTIPRFRAKSGQAGSSIVSLADFNPTILARAEVINLRGSGWNIMGGDLDLTSRG